MIIEKEQQKTETRTLKDYIVLAAKGFCMGAADVVPGVSGGTMAFIMGIYEELINSIKGLLDPQIFKAAFRFQIKELFELVPWQFLGTLGFGILLAIFTLAKFLESALVNYPALIWSFFLGLVIASIITVTKRVTRWYSGTILAMGAGTYAAYKIVGMVPVETPTAPWFLFLSGFIAICAMILPGISGSFLLVLMGKYEYILSAVNNRDFVTLFIVAAGAGIGLVTFAQVLSWLFKRYHDITVAILIGLMIGSLRKIWPWKETLETIIDRHGEVVPVVQQNVLPQAWTSEVTLALILAVIGFALVVALDYWASSQERKEAHA
ncbi:MAG: DUF368 domain-containing protein [Anaerolineae bacterium]|nr:DUF368 domain-containing protein [Anaerolineae bacterium]